MNQLTNLLIVVGLVLAIGISAQAQYDDGNGSAEFPYEIAEPNQLIYMSEHPEHWDKHFKLMVDLDLTGITMSPIGNDTTPFSGSFNGNGHTIADLTITSNGAGLFNTVDGGEIRSLGLVGTYYRGNTYYLGSLVGRLRSGIISECFSRNYHLYGGGVWGGLVGYNGGTITKCYATGFMDEPLITGGLVGINSGSIIKCYASGWGSHDSVNGACGGLVAGNSGLIMDCYSTFACASLFPSFGGLVVDNWGTGTIYPNFASCFHKSL